MFVVTVSFTIKPEKLGEFLPRMLENARLSVSLEPGCQRFDVCSAKDETEKIFLYEVYDDEAAFAAHKKMNHFLEFDDVVGPLITSKTVKTYTVLN